MKSSLALILLFGCLGTASCDASSLPSNASDSVDAQAPLVVQSAPAAGTGIMMTTYSLPGANIHAGYFDQPLYVDEVTFYAVSDLQDGANVYLVEPDAFTKLSSFDELHIYDDTHRFGLTLVLSDDWLFYGDGRSIYRHPLGALNSASIFHATDQEHLWAPLHVTDDGQFVTTTITRDDEAGVNYIARIDFDTGETDYLQSPVLGTENPFVDHAQIHPDDRNRVMFAHEGSWVLDRAWLWTIDQDHAEPIWIHPAFTEAGHEKWAANGEDILIVQYGQPARNIPSGINRIDPLGQVTEIGHNSEYYLSHFAFSPDEHYFVADTYRRDDAGSLWLVLYDIAGERYHQVTEIDLLIHPAHPHPSWSPSGEKFMFTDMDEGRMVIREVRLEDVLASSS